MTQTQLSFFPVDRKPKPSGQSLRDRGIKRSVQHAEDVEEGWKGKALSFLEAFARQGRGQKFSGEMVRLAAKSIVPTPPSLRAWGSVLLSASKRGWIRQVGWVKVTNPKAHQANAALWRSCLG